MDPFALPTFFSSIFDQVNQIVSTVSQVISAIEIIGFIVIIGKCIFAAFNLVWALLQWFGYFMKWLFDPWPPHFMTPQIGDEEQYVGFICWLVRYIIVIFYKITALPKCFLWYFLDTAGWILYLPFRFIFWLIDWMMSMNTLQDSEKKAWRFLDEIDYFLHGKPRDNYFIYQYAPYGKGKNNKEVDGEGKPINQDGKDPNSLNLGFHIIHFPDSVMYQCYSIVPFALAKGPKFPVDEISDFFSCVMNPF